ncbi:MAG: FAD-dependent oxidoreductase [Desulfuromonadales bacterium]|nr:FAD-dependent oxidoreductase [Desulfuromonadales bacterium]
MPTLKVHNIVFRHDDLFELLLERGGVSFEPGACMALFNNDGDSRPYSISAGTKENVLRFLIRRVPNGRVSHWLSQRKPGDKVEASDPFGWFRPGRSATTGERCVFIATGTGIAPFLSHLRSNPALPPEACLYGVRKLADAFALDELECLKVFSLAVSRESNHDYFHGRVTGLCEQIPLAAGIHYYLCGLDTMIEETSRWLESSGIDYTHIHREIFFYEDGQD